MPRKKQDVAKKPCKNHKYKEVLAKGLCAACYYRAWRKVKGEEYLEYRREYYRRKQAEKGRTVRQYTRYIFVDDELAERDKKRKNKPSADSSCDS